MAEAVQGRRIPTEAALRKELNAIKGEQLPWMREVTKNVPQQAIKNLGKSYTNFFEDLAEFKRGKIAGRACGCRPSRKRVGATGSAPKTAPDKNHPDAVQTCGKAVRLPVIGWIAMREEVRFAGRILSVVVSRRADQWYAKFLHRVRTQGA